MLKDKPLLKLLYYDVNTPLTKPDVPNPNSLLFNRIYPIPKIPEAQEDKKSILTVLTSHARLNKKNIKFKDYKILFNVICHIDLWAISGAIRPYEICARIDGIFNEARGTQLSLGQVVFEDLIFREYNNKFTGFYLCYKTVDFN